MNCTLKTTAGPDAGKQFDCTGPQTVIGKSPNCAVRLSGAGLSYEHALITRAGDEFFIENLSAAGTLLNDQRIIARTRLRPKDIIRLGSETIVRVQSLPAAAGAAPRRGLLFAVIALLILLLIVVLWDPFTAEAPPQNLDRAYNKLLDYTRREVQARRLPDDALQRLQDAWRLTRAGQQPEAAKQWSQLLVILLTGNDAPHLNALAADYPHALNDSLLNPKPDAKPPEDDELGAALVQFTRLMERRESNSQQSP